MKFSPVALVLGTAAAAERVVPMRFSRQYGNHLIRRADGDLTQTLLNNVTTAAYYVQAAVGTPPQPALFILDTGSSDTWVLDVNADFCNMGDGPSRCPYTYNPEESDSYELAIDGGFNITYVSGEFGIGDYITEDFHIAGVTVKGLQIAVAHNATSPTGALGVGFDATEAAADKYPNLITEMMNQELIDAAAYSVFLDGRDADYGTILFGGMDTEKYSGELQLLDVRRDAQNQYNSLTVDLDGLAVSASDGTVTTVLDASIPIALDTGTTLTYLPEDVVAQIYDMLGVYNDTADSGLAYVSCSIVDSDDFRDTTFDFRFGGPDGQVVRVGLSDLIFDYVKSFVMQGFQIPDDLPFDDPCSFGIQTLPGYYLLGDSFLRSAYVVFDLTNKQVGIAQAVYNSNSSNIVEITKDDGISLGSGSDDDTSSSSSVPTPTSTSAQSSPTGQPSPTDASSPPEDASPTPSDTGNAAPRLAPGWNGEPGAVMLILHAFGLVGAIMFAL